VSAEIDVIALAARLATGERTRLVDVREPWEFERVRIAGSVNIPLGELAARAHEIPHDPTAMIVTICHHGVRSLRAHALLVREGRGEVRSLTGGVDAWAELIDPSMPRY
jgi:rhodanese-related sulfurtransferase